MEKEELKAAAFSDSMVLRTEGLIKKYGKRTVVNGVSFDVKQGEIVGLLGPNGAGKTTSFYMTTGLVVPNGGRILPIIRFINVPKQALATLHRKPPYSGK